MGAAEHIVDMLLETGEADQDYDHEAWDAVVRALDNAGIDGSYHREFDKYQGVYLGVPGVGRFWLDEMSGPDLFILVEQHDPENKVAVFLRRAGGDYAVDASALISYCNKALAPHRVMRSAMDFIDQNAGGRRPGRPRKMPPAP